MHNSPTIQDVMERLDRFEAGVTKRLDTIDRNIITLGTAVEACVRNQAETASLLKDLALHLGAEARP